MRRRLFVLVIGLAITILALAWLRTRPGAAGRTWRDVHSFAYQLQDLNLHEVATSPFDLVVFDPTAEGGESSRWTPKQVASLQRKPDGRRRYLVAYLSIGEAEEYREYWRPEFRPGSPAWLGQPNPQWPDNYTVAYWDPDWQATILRAVDKVVQAGFDGVYLDIVDAYERFPDRPTAEDEMCQFVARIARHARASAGADFGVFAQNGEGLIDHPEYFQALTGLGREDTYFGYPSESQASAPEWTSSIEKRLDHAVGGGKLVLNIDYTQISSQKAEAHARARARGYLEYVCGRALSRLEKQDDSPPEAAASQGGVTVEEQPKR